MKCCRRCGQKKPLTEFYAHPFMADGHLNYCKDCKRVEATLRRDANLGEARLRQRRRYQLSKSNGQKREWQRRKRQKNPLKYKAYNAVARAVASGKLVPKPCAVCGDLPTEAHHHDYSKPLEVNWLCQKHHLELHRRETRRLVLQRYPDKGISPF
jgi:hypothetical protein